MTDCLFCKIIAGDIPAEKLYEDDRVLVFKDINALAPEHFLVMKRCSLFPSLGFAPSVGIDFLSE